jgi:glutathione S-transferase
MRAPTTRTRPASGAGTKKAEAPAASAAKVSAAKALAAKTLAAKTPAAEAPAARATKPSATKSAKAAAPTKSVASKPAAKPAAKPKAPAAPPRATLTISSKNYSSWSLRGWLLCRMAGLEFAERQLSADDPSIRAELLLQSSSFLVPCLEHEGLRIWDTLSIGEYLNEIAPEAALLPKDKAARAHCRSICGEMHSGFANLRSALPMNIKVRHPGFKVWTGAQADIERILAIWRECLAAYGGPYLFGAMSMADAMYAPVCSRFTTYDVKLEPATRDYCRLVLSHPAVREWSAAAKVEPDELEELDVEF